MPGLFPVSRPAGIRQAVGLSHLSVVGYREVGLIATAARGDLDATQAAEGERPAVFWAGPAGSNQARLDLKQHGASWCGTP